MERTLTSSILSREASNQRSRDRGSFCFPHSEIRAVEGEGGERRRILSFSSEEPYERWFGPEILDHGENAVDLGRLASIGCLLYNHNRDKVIGKILRAWVENGRGCAEVEFDGDEASETIFQKVASGTLKGVSVGYRVDSWEEVMPGKQSADGKYTGPCSIARKWTPLEISIVSVPADATVGVGREETKQSEKGASVMGEDERKETTAPEKAAVVEKQQKDSAAAVSDPVAQERKRAADITALCRDFGRDPQEYIQSGAAMDEVRQAILEELRRTKGPVSIHVERDEEDKFRDAASDALLMRAGIEVEKPAEGARELMGLRLRDMAIEAMERGESGFNRRISDDELYSGLTRQFYNPSAAFPSIMDQTIRKSYESGYQKAGVTFDRWTGKGVLTDFKTTQAGYLVGSAGELLLVPESGELKHDTPTDHRTPTRKLETYGRQFTMSRQAFINDDIGFLTTVPARYASSSRKTINKQVYGLLLKNPKIYDGVPLFAEAHSNLIAAGTGVTSEAIQASILKLQMQKDQDGDAILVSPAYLIIPVGYGFTVRTILDSPTIHTAENTQAVNPLYRMSIEVIEDPTLNAMSGEGAAVPWFIAADKADIRTIQVDYLNGQEIPNIRRSEKAGQLGFIWDVYLDWGVSVLDWRGIVKNPGTVIGAAQTAAKSGK